MRSGGFRARTKMVQTQFYLPPFHERSSGGYVPHAKS